MLMAKANASERNLFIDAILVALALPQRYSIALINGMRLVIQLDCALADQNT